MSYARRPHKKTKTGCMSCKRRRIKCDETKPTCLRCQKKNLQYIYLSGPLQVWNTDPNMTEGALPSFSHPQSMKENTPLPFTTNIPDHEPHLMGKNIHTENLNAIQLQSNGGFDTTTPLKGQFQHQSLAGANCVSVPNIPNRPFANQQSLALPSIVPVSQWEYSYTSMHGLNNSHQYVMYTNQHADAVNVNREKVAYNENTPHLRQSYSEGAIQSQNIDSFAFNTTVFTGNANNTVYDFPNPQNLHPTHNSQCENPNDFVVFHEKPAFIQQYQQNYQQQPPQIRKQSSSQVYRQAYSQSYQQTYEEDNPISNKYDSNFTANNMKHQLNDGQLHLYTTSNISMQKESSNNTPAYVDILSSSASQRSTIFFQEADHGKKMGEKSFSEIDKHELRSDYSNNLIHTGNNIVGEQPTDDPLLLSPNPMTSIRSLQHYEESQYLDQNKKTQVANPTSHDIAHSLEADIADVLNEKFITPKFNLSYLSDTPIKNEFLGYACYFELTAKVQIYCKTNLAFKMTSDQLCIKLLSDATEKSSQYEYLLHIFYSLSFISLYHSNSNDIFGFEPDVYLELSDYHRVRSIQCLNNEINSKDIYCRRSWLRLTAMLHVFCAICQPTQKIASRQFLMLYKNIDFINEKFASSDYASALFIEGLERANIRKCSQSNSAYFPHFLYDLVNVCFPDDGSGKFYFPMLSNNDRQTIINSIDRLLILFRGCRNRTQSDETLYPNLWNTKNEVLEDDMFFTVYRLFHGVSYEFIELVALGEPHALIIIGYHIMFLASKVNKMFPKRFYLDELDFIYQRLGKLQNSSIWHRWLDPVRISLNG